MPFMGGPLDGQPVDPNTLGQADAAGALDLNSLLAGLGEAGSASPDAPGGGPMGPPPPMAAPPGGTPPMSDPAAGGPLPNESDAPQDAAQSEVEVLDRILSDMLTVAGGSELSQQDKASIQKAMTLVQQIKANEEKEQQAALGGKLSPRLLSKAYGG